jgi:hypothetical protein
MGRQRRQEAEGEGEEEGRQGDTCLNYGKTRHWARDCKEPRRQGRAHLVQDNIKELTLLMAEVCAMEAPRAHVLLDKTCVVVNLGRNGEEDFERWFLDNDAHDREPSGVHRPRHQRHEQRQVR